MINGKGFLIFATGVLVGTVSSIYVLKTRYEAKLEVEVEHLRDIYKKNSLRTSGRYDWKEKSNDKRNTVTEQEHQEEVLDDHVPVYEKNKVVNIYKNPSLAEMQHPMDSEEEGTVVVHQAPPYGRTDPYLIDDDQFMEDCEHHEKITLCYHSDGILAEEDETVIEDPIEAVGVDTLNQFDDPDIDVIYVRNCNVGIDYEIIRTIATYASLKQDGGDYNGNKS